MIKRLLLPSLTGLCLSCTSCSKKVDLLTLAKPGFQGVTPVVLNEKKPGSTVDLAPYLGRDQKYVLVEYYADWCPPCRSFLPLLNQLPSKFSNLTVYRINIDKWKSPICQQDKINSVPAFTVYGPDGKQIARDDAAKDWLQAQLDQLSR